MAKFFGKVGYGVIRNDALVGTAVSGTDFTGNPPDPENPYAGLDIHQEYISERSYYGDVFKDSRQLEKGQGVNDDIKVNNRISIVADAFAFEHFFAIRYVVWMGTKWKVSDVEVQHPRLILSIGGVWNGSEEEVIR